MVAATLADFGAGIGASGSSGASRPMDRNTGEISGLVGLGSPPLHSPTLTYYPPTVALMRRRLSCNGAPGRAAGYAGVGSGGALPTVGPSLPTSTTTSYQLMQGAALPTKGSPSLPTTAFSQLPFLPDSPAGAGGCA